MSKIWTITQKEFKTYFTSPLAYVVISFFLLLTGISFYSLFNRFIQISTYNVANKPLSINKEIMAYLLGNMNIFLLMLIPFVTMRLFSEERKSHTIELLITSPITLMDIILGKFFSSLMLITTMLGLTLIYPIILFATGNPELGPILTGYLGIIFQTCFYLSLGLLFSSMTENQIVAGLITFVVSLYFYLVSLSAFSAGPVWGEVLKYISPINHYHNFLKGIISSADIVYYLSLTGISLFLTHRTLDSYRWR